MLTAMIEFENGWLMPYTDEQLNTAIIMAGIRMPNEMQVQKKTEDAV
jgi:hypothetical protein